MAQRASYWSCSKFAKWVSTMFGARPKMRSGTSEEWSEWRKDVRKKHPAVYWFNEEFLNAAQNFIWWPYDKVCDARYYLFNRYVSKTHYIKTGLKPGEYHYPVGILSVSADDRLMRMKKRTRGQCTSATKPMKNALKANTCWRRWT
jgi:hypothetical protein